MDTINGLRETLPNEYLQAYGVRNCESGNFRYMKLCKYLIAWNYLGTLGSTQWNIRSGVGGGRSDSESKKVWTRHDELSTQTNHMDNHKEHVSCAPYEEVRWGAHWNGTRSRGGWTTQAALGESWCGITWKQPHSREDFRGWSCGLSECDIAHAP